MLLPILLTVLVFVIIVIFTISIYRLAKHNSDYYQNIPGPKPLPLFGNIIEVSSTEDVLDALLKWMKEFGDVFKISVGPFRKLIVVSEYKLVEQILSSPKFLAKSDDYNSLKSWLGTGLLTTSDGIKWKKHRKTLTPAFHFKILERFIGVFETEGLRLVQKLQSEVGKPTFDVYPYVALCTLDIICGIASAMGTSVNAQDNDDSAYVQSVNTMCKIVIERIFHLLQIFNFSYPLTNNYYRERKALDILHTHTNTVINKRRFELKNEEKTFSNSFFENKKKKTFLDLLLEITIDDQKLTQEEIREEVDTFMFGGQDTTSSAISFVIYCLAHHSDVQKEAYEEQQALFGSEKNPEITYSDLQSMKYLELVIKETLRIYPPVPFYGRKTTEEIKCADGSVIPKDVTLGVFAFGLHRNPKYFPEPEKFHPRRFESFSGSFPFSYIPFSAGPRNCLGQKFAMLEMKSVISKILRYFELSPPTPKHELILSAEIILKSSSGMKIAINTRK